MSTTGNPFGMSNTRAQAAAQLPNFAQLFTADPTYKNFRSLNQQFTQIANAFGQGNSPFSLQDIQEGASAFQQAVNPYAQQFSEQSNREALALRMAEQQQLAAQGQGAPMQQAAFAQPAYSPAFPSSFPQQSPYSNFYGSPQLQSAINSRYGGGNQNVIPLEGRFGLVRLAGGGEVSEARRMLQNLQNANEVQAGQMINRFAGGGYAAGRFNRAMVEPDAITGRGDRNLFELFDRNDRAMIAPVGPNEDGGFGPPAYTAPEPAPIAEPLPPPVAEPLPPPVAEPLPPPVAEPLPPPVAEPQLQKDGFLPLLRPVLPPAPVEQVQRLIQEGRVPSNYVTGPYDAQGLSDEDMTRWIASTYEPGGANAPGALPYIFAPDYVDPLQKAYEQAQENAARAYQEVLDKRAAEQPPSPPPMAEPLPPPMAEPLPPPVAEPTPEPPPVAEPPGGIVTLPERPPVAELPRVISPEPPPAIPEPPPPITLPEIKERPVEPIKVPKVDEEFRSSPVRSFDPVTGSFRYTPPTKLDSATGAGTTWTPPTITSRKRQLLNVDYLPGIDVPQYDPLTNQLYQPALSASQRFAGDRNMQMAALQQLKTASPMSSATYLALQSRLRAGEFGGIGGQPVDMERLKAAATAMVPPVLGLKIGSLSDTAGGSQGSNVPAGFGSGVPVTLGVPTIGRKDGGEVSTEDFIKKQSGGDVSRETASPNTAEVPQVDTEGQLIDEREEIRSESQRMLNRLQSQPSKLPPGIRRAVAETRAQGKESMFPVAAPARDLLSGILGASPTAPGSQAYRTGQAIANMPPVQAAAAIPAKIAASAGDAATALAAMGPAVGAVMKPKGGNWLAPSVERGLNYLIPRTGAGNRTAKETLEEMNRTYPAEELAKMPETRAVVDRAYQWLEPNVAIQNWIEKKLTKYVKNEMATPEDPVRALAERGILHVDPEQLNSYPGAGNPANQAVARRALGYPEEGLAKSEAAKRWETASDYMIQTDRALNLLNPKEYGQGFVDQTLAANPWLTKVDPYERIYGVDTLNYRPDYSELGFDHLIDELKNSLNPNSGLPRALQLTPKQLDKVSVPQAVELVDKINKWRAEQKAAADIKRSQNAATVEYKAYDTIPGTTEPNQRGLRWVELRTPEITSADQLTPEAQARYKSYLSTGVGEEAALRQAAKHDESLAESLKYEGEVMGHCVGGYCPDVQEGRSRIYSLRDKKGEPHVTIEVQHGEMRGGQSVEDYLNQSPQIVQIKGKANRAPKDEYLPFVQDFVRSGQWSSVGDFKNTGLIRKSDYIDTFTPEMLDSVGVGEYMTKEEFNQLADKLGGINKMATGGAVRMKDGGPVNVSRGTSEVPQLDAEGRLIDENAEMRSEAQRMLNRLKTAQQESYRRGKLPQKNEDAEKVRKDIREGMRALVGMGPYDETNPTEAYRIAATPTPLAAVGMIGRKGLLGMLDKARGSTAFKGRGLDVAESEQFSVKELMNRLKEQGIDVDRTWLRGKKDPGGGFEKPPTYEYLEAVYEYQKRPDAIELALRDAKQGRPWSRAGTVSRQPGDRDVTKANTKGGVWLTESPTIAESYSGDRGFIIPVLTRRPEVVLDAKGEQWDEFFKTSKEFKEAQKDPNVKSIEVKNIIDFGDRSKLPSGLSDDELRKLLTANNLFLKKPFVDKDVVSKLTGEPFPYQDGGPVNVPRETSTSKQQLDKLAQVSQRKKA